MNHRFAHSVVLAAVVSTSPGLASADPVFRPFKATLQTQEVIGVDPSRCPNAPYLVGNTVGAGTATRMGAVTLASSDCPIPSDANPLPAKFRFLDGKLTLTGANGDQLNAAYRGRLVPAGGSAAPGLYRIVGWYTVLGGTGRFNQAIGGGELSGHFYLPSGQASYTAVGMIAYKPSLDRFGPETAEDDTDY